MELESRVAIEITVLNGGSRPNGVDKHHTNDADSISEADCEKTDSGLGNPYWNSRYYEPTTVLFSILETQYEAPRLTDLYVCGVILETYDIT